MTVHLISVGLSLLAAAYDPREKVTDPFVQRALREHPPRELLSPARDAGDVLSQLETMLRDSHQPSGEVLEFRGRVRETLVDRWPGSISAEVETFEAETGDARLSCDDTVVLVASDTPDGVRAAFWNAAALTAGDLTRISIVNRPQHVQEVPNGSVGIAMVRGMDVGTEQGFAEAMSALGALARGLLDRPKTQREGLTCHLSGGFKAAIPYLLAVAEWVKSAGDRWSGEVSAIVRHETTTSGPIHLPLRQLPLAAIELEVLSGWDADGRRCDRPGHAVLEGYAYVQDRNGSGWRMTPFGLGLKEVFRTTQSSLPR
jgi:hypothetical protein